MATRTISTRLAIEGENEYRQAVKNCNSEMATMRSELARVQSQYQGSANSSEALTAKGNALNAMYEKQQQKVQQTQSALDNAKNAQASYAAQVENFSTRIAGSQAELERLRNTTGNTTRAQRDMQQQIASLNRELAQAEEKEQAAARGVTDWTRQNNYAQRDLNNLSREIEQNRRYLDEAANSTNRCAHSIDEYGREVRDAGAESDRFGQHSTAAIDALSAALAASGVVVALNKIKESLTECVKSAMDFEAGMAEVYTLLPGESQVAYGKLSDDMMKFSGDMNVLTEKAVPALYQAVSSGVPKDNVFDFMTTAQKAAVGGVTELETSVDGLTSIVNAYGEKTINAAQTSDMMFTAVRLGKTNFEQLSGSIYNVVPTAVAAKVGFDNVAASLAVITAQGVPTSVATTQLRQMFVELASSTSKVGMTFEEVSGQSFKKFIAGGGNVQQALQKLETYAGQTGIGVNELFSSVEAGNSALSLTGQATESFTKALEEMKNSAGATDQAYETMTQTAEYAAQRVTVSFDNLKAAIGDVLLPAFADLAEGSASGLEWAGELIEQNPWVVQAVTAITVALGTFTASVVAAKTAMILFNFVMKGNPAVRVASAIGVVVAALSIFALSAKKGSEAAENLNEGSEKAAGSLEKIKKACDNTVKSTTSTADAAKKYIERLKELEAQGLKTEASHAEYEAIVRKLQTLLPDLNITLNEQTGIVEGGTDALTLNTEAWKRNAEEKAFQDKYSAILEEQAKVTVEVAENQRVLNETEGDGILLKQQKSELEASINEKMETETGLQRLMDDTLKEQQQTLRELNTEIGTNEFRQTKLKEAVEQGQAVVSDYDNELKKAAETQDIMTGATAGTEESLAGLNAALSNAHATYGKLAKEARDSIDKQIGAWEEMDNQTKTSTDTLNKALQSQITYLTNYSSNLEKLSGRNIEGVDKLVASLSDGSKESAAILAGMAGATDEQIKKVIENMGKVEEGKTKFSDVAAGVSKEFKDEMAIVVEESNKYKEMYANGSNAVQGLIDGAEEKRRDLINKYASLAKAADVATRKQLDIQSPSKVFSEIGSYTIEGMMQGIESRESDLAETMSKAVDVAIEGFGEKNEKAKDMAKQFLDTYNEAIKEAGDTTKEVAEILKGKLDEITDAFDEVSKKQEEMQKKLSEYGNLFNVDSKTDEMTLGSLDDQINTLNKYDEALTKLKENGITDGLMNEILGMDIDDAINYGDQLLDMYEISPEKWEEYNKKWEEKQALARSIAETFYKNELEALEGEYNTQLAIGLDALKGTSYESGVDTIEGLMDGMRSKEAALYAQAQGIANKISSIINSALSSGESGSGKKKNGSHALGLNYVPFDGYIAELHKGERVLTASETRDYIAASMPSSFDIPAPQRSTERQTEAMINAMGTLMGGMSQQGADGPKTIILQMGDGTEMARWLLPSIRVASDQSPRVERDFR